MADLSLVQVGKRYGDRTIIEGLDLHVQSGEMVCLLGPSGSGKTTILRMIGGFIHSNEGQIIIDGLPVTNVPPERRPTSMVFQQYALWPNMTVYQNIAFGLKLRRLSKREISQRVAEVLQMVDLRGLEKYYPAQLSGGQQQRVALARALVLTPKVLLLDEPLSNLDAQLRHKVREEIREIQQRLHITTIFVTHDQDEAMSVSDRVAVLSEGHIEQFDTPDNLYLHPETNFVARFIGSMNVFRGRIRNGFVYAESSEHNEPVPCEHSNATSTTPVDLAVRPEDILITNDIGATARVLRRLPRGHYAEIVLETSLGTLRAFVPNQLSIGEIVKFRFGRALVYQGGRLVKEEANMAQRVAQEGVTI